MDRYIILWIIQCDSNSLSELVLHIFVYIINCHILLGDTGSEGTTTTIW